MNPASSPHPTPPATRPARNNYYRSLDSAGIVSAITQLYKRVCRRFPDSGLSKVAAELLQISKEAAERTAEIERAHIPLRVGTGFLLVAATASILWLIADMRLNLNITSVLDLFQGLESTINLLLLTAAGIWSLVSLEARIKRTAALRMLHELRVLAHLVDMHQLTKDPKSFSDAPDEQHPPGTTLTTLQLTQYLDYCCDMLSLIGKIAALYAQYFNDRVELQAIDEIESLTTSMSRKIWQKIMILHEVSSHDLQQ